MLANFRGLLRESESRPKSFDRIFVALAPGWLGIEADFYSRPERKDLELDHGGPSTSQNACAIARCNG